MAACWEVCLCVVADFPLLLANSQRNWALFAFQQSPSAQQHHTGVWDHAACSTHIFHLTLLKQSSLVYFTHKKNNNPWAVFEYNLCSGYLFLLVSIQISWLNFKSQDLDSIWFHIYSDLFWYVLVILKAPACKRHSLWLRLQWLHLFILIWGAWHYGLIEMQFRNTDTWN